MISPSVTLTRIEAKQIRRALGFAASWIEIDGRDSQAVKAATLLLEERLSPSVAVGKASPPSSPGETPVPQVSPKPDAELEDLDRLYSRAIFGTHTGDFGAKERQELRAAALHALPKLLKLYREGCPLEPGE